VISSFIPLRGLHFVVVRSIMIGPEAIHFFVQFVDRRFVPQDAMQMLFPNAFAFQMYPWLDQVRNYSVPAYGTQIS
jgi:hypothetical protein